jgi:hypothetical protein
MGAVYKAEDTWLHRAISLKFLPSEMPLTTRPLSNDSGGKAQAASALNHPNICTIHDRRARRLAIHCHGVSRGTTVEHSDGWNGLYSAFGRGEAYLAARQGSEAAGELQKILDHGGILINEPIGAIAHLGLARAHVLQGDTAKDPRRISGFPHALEGRCPTFPETGQSRIREVALNSSVL